MYNNILVKWIRDIKNDFHYGLISMLTQFNSLVNKVLCSTDDFIDLYCEIFNLIFFNFSLV